MKPFNFQRAEAGDPICMTLASGDLPIPARFVGVLTDGRIAVERCADSGVYYIEVCELARLRMATKKRTVYINAYSHTKECWRYDDRVSAVAGAGSAAIAIAVPIEIED